MTVLSVCLVCSSSCIVQFYNDDNIQMVAEKWKVFGLTFISYSLIHAVRTAWSSLKYVLNSAPYAFQPFFLGVLDMIVLLTLALSLNLFGPKIEQLGAKAFLLKGMLLLAGIMGLLGLLLLLKVSTQLPYTILYTVVGFGSCVGWPASIFILSKYFQKGLAFSLWTGSSQFGDFIALMLSFLLVQEAKINPGFFLWVVALLLVGAYFLNKSLLPDDQPRTEAELPQESPVNVNALVEEGEAEPPLSNSQMATGNNANPNKGGVNFITVWTLPGVAGYILSFLFVKSVNAVVVAWLIFYLSMIGMKHESRIIAVLWAISTFFGGLLGSYFNPKFNKAIFVASLLASAILFIFLEEVHLYPSETEVIILVLTCGLIFGGPFTLMTSSIPLLLSQKPEIRCIPGAKAAIISAMQGYGLLFCGISLLIVPAVGVIDLHWVASLYCTISAAILLYEHLKDLNQQLKDQSNRKHVSSPVIELPKEKEMNMSAPVISSTEQKRKRRSKKKETPLKEIPKSSESMQAGNEQKAETVAVDNNILPEPAKKQQSQKQAELLESQLQSSEAQSNANS